MLQLAGHERLPIGTGAMQMDDHPRNLEKTGEEWSREWRRFRSTITQLPTLSPPNTRALLGGKWPIWVKMIMTCDFNKYMRVTTHWKRKIRIHLECDCPDQAEAWDDQ
jgi:hypothetical protein